MPKSDCQPDRFHRRTNAAIIPSIQPPHLHQVARPEHSGLYGPPPANYSLLIASSFLAVIPSDPPLSQLICHPDRSRRFGGGAEGPHPRQLSAHLAKFRQREVEACISPAPSAVASAFRLILIRVIRVNPRLHLLLPCCVVLLQCSINWANTVRPEFIPHCCRSACYPQNGRDSVSLYAV